MKKTEEIREGYSQNEFGEPDDRYADEFDEWLQSIRADAWNEGFDNGYDQVLVEKSVRPDAGDLRVNPYDTDITTTQDAQTSSFGLSPAESITIRKGAVMSSTEKDELERIIQQWDDNGDDEFGKFDNLVDALWAARYRKQPSGERPAENIPVFDFDVISSLAGLTIRKEEA